MSVANILSMAGGLGLFLFGIRTMGDGLENAAGAKLKRMLEVLTGNRFLAVLVGFVVTAIIQSSTATTVMVVGFVNAGMMSLAQAVGVIMGANIRTTVTSLLIALNFSSVAAASVLVGVILMLASKKTVVKNLGAIFTGFGLLFLGIDMMSDHTAVISPAMILMKGRRSIFPIFHPRSNIPGITGSQNCFFPGILLFLIRMISIPVRQIKIHP